MKKTGFYIIKDQFFEDMPDPYLPILKFRKIFNGIIYKYWYG